MNQQSAERIIANAAKCQTIYQGFCQNCQQLPRFARSFHLRPTGDGVTIVSTLPYAPMRGIAVSCAGLDQALRALDRDLSQLPQAQAGRAAAQLSAHGFHVRANPNDSLEEAAQAAFIRGMIEGEPQYEGIQFLASELNLEEANRLDVVGVKENILYLFELKKGRTTRVFQQVAGYVRHVQHYLPLFQRLLQSYPALCQVPALQAVQGVAVLRQAENTRQAAWTQSIQDTGVSVWFYRPALAFEKWNPVQADG